MVKLTKVSIAIALSLMISVLLFTSGAFAQSVQQSSATVTKQAATPALANWGGSRNRSDFWRNPWGQEGCGSALCGENNGFGMCRSVMKSISVWRTRRIAVVVKTLRLLRQTVFIHRFGRTVRIVREIKQWQVRHEMRTIRTLQVLKRSVRVCGAW
jgi:hypothetical protein